MGMREMFLNPIILLYTPIQYVSDINSPKYIYIYIYKNSEDQK